MIGNDIVDLSLAVRQSNWRRRGFLQKVFSQGEQEMISRAPDGQTMVWLLWSMKEAAYKAFQREFNLPRSLNWLEQQCSLQSNCGKTATGEVMVNGKIYDSFSEVNEGFIHTYVESKNQAVDRISVLQTCSYHSRFNLMRDISHAFQVDEEVLEIKKDRFGKPFCTNNDDFTFSNFSLSGHGRFSAYILSLINCETPVKQS